MTPLVDNCWQSAKRNTSLLDPRLGAAMASALALSLAACSSSDSPASDAGTVKAAVPCESLQSLSVPSSAIGLATSGATVTGAEPVSDVDPGGNPRSYCKVTGQILPVDPAAAPIRFEVNLPDDWNRRLLQMGGGGTNGTVVTGLGLFTGQPAGVPTALARGYVTLGSDSGHNADNDPPFDTHFGLNQEQLLNFGQLQIKKTLDTAKFIVHSAYERRPVLFTLPAARRVDTRPLTRCNAIRPTTTA